MSDYDFYEVERTGAVAQVYLNRPEKKNALNPPAWAEAPAVFGELDRDAKIRAIVLSGRGSCFSSGIDIMAMAPEVPELMNPDQKGGVKWRLWKRIAPLQETMTAIERCRKPVIAAVHGHCIGGGLNMIAACDIRLCSADATFCLKEAAVGFVADVGALQRLPHIVGQGLTRELAFTARTIDAARAKEIGLVNEVYDDPEALMKAALEMAQAISENSPLSVQASKEALNFGIGKSIDDGLRYVASLSANIIPSDDLMESMAASAQKRKPVFKGEEED